MLPKPQVPQEPLNGNPALAHAINKYFTALHANQQTYVNIAVIF